MRNIFKSLFLLAACLATTVAWAQVQSFTAAEIKSGTKKEAVSVSTDLNVANKQMCKENSKGVKLDAVEGGNSANTVDEKYVQISSTAEMSKIYLHATFNSSGNGKKMAFLYWKENVTPAVDNILGAELVSFPGYDGACDANYVTVTPPSDARIVRIYRQLKNFDGTGYKKGATYGENTTFLIADIDVTAGPAPKSTDATLKDLQIGGVTIDGFSSSVTEYNYVIAATATTMPTITATKNDSKASDPVITPTSMPTAGNPTQATITVTAEDGTTTKTYTITFTRAELSHDATLKDIQVDGVSVSGFSPSVTSYNVTIPYSQTSIPTVTATPNFPAATYIVIPSGMEGQTQIVVTAEDGTTKETYTLSFTKAAPSTDATLKSLSYNGTDVPGFSPTQKTYSIDIQSGSALPILQGMANHPYAKISYQQVTSLNGTATATVTAEDGTTTQTYSVTFKEITGPPVPYTTLTLHEPGIYAEEGQKGGYGAKLYIDNTGRAYEVYYSGRIEEKVDGETKKGLTIHTTPADKSRGITKNETETSYEAIDGWFKGTGTDKGTGFAAKDEFNKATERCHAVTSSNSIEMHIKGYDQFSLYAADKKWEPSKPSDCKYFKVSIDNEEQTPQPSTSQTIRRFDMSAGEHVIKITLVGDGNLFGGFSLREAQIPMVSHVRGNDSTQVVLQTENLPRAITYYTKYNKLGETRVIWEDKEATGIELKVKSSTEIGDTLVLSGQAMCEVGVYPFHVSSFFNGVETKRLPSGKITVTSDIRSIGEPKVEVYQGEAMEELEFSYHALSADAITLTWTNGTPDGVTGHGENGKYYISGIPTQIGEFTFTISVKGGNSIDGLVSVKELVIGDNPVLYLYTNADAYTKDGIITFLTTKGYDFVPRKAKRDGLRPTEDYKKYNWVLISEDANADNAEVLALTKESSILPVLNMKSFSYAPERLGWGDPNNGSLAADGQYITVQRDDHPIFKALQKNRGSKIQVLSKIEEKGLMPIDIDLPGTHSLATSLMRAKDDYYGSGDPQTFLHEVPAGMRGGKKYICMPIAISSSKNLTPSGKDLIVAVVNYLLNDEPSIQIPQLQITSFTINGIAGKIDGEANKIIFEIDLAEHTDIDKFAIAPQVTIASDYTHVTPASGETIDFSESWSYPVAYEVSDFINRRVYDVAIRFYSSEGIEDVYAVGDWVNIYDIFGRKVSTTNEDIYRMVLPRGIYIIVTETGETFKIMR